MSFVMVPVPNERVLEVMQFVTRLAARASAQVWDAESMTEVFATVDDASRSLLVLAARTSAAGAAIDAVEAARVLELGVRETAAIVNELNSIARETNRPNLITAPAVTQRSPDGSMTERRMIQMDPELVELVQAAERVGQQGER